MEKETIMDNENKPIRLFLKDNKTFFYGTYSIKDSKTISLTDRKHKTFPIDTSLIGIIEPVDKIIYIESHINP